MPQGWKDRILQVEMKKPSIYGSQDFNPRTSCVHETERRPEAKVGEWTGDRHLSIARSCSCRGRASCLRSNAPTALNADFSPEFKFYTQTVMVNKAILDNQGFEINRIPQTLPGNVQMKTGRKRRGSDWKQARPGVG